MAPDELGMQTYPEYCRALYDANSAEFAQAAEDLEKIYGRVSCPQAALCDTTVL